MSWDEKPAAGFDDLAARMTEDSPYHMGGPSPRPDPLAELAEGAGRVGSTCS